MANFLQQIVSTRQASETSEFGYPAAACVFVMGNGVNSFHLIFASGDSGDAPGALYDNAPNGSIYIPLTTTAANYNIRVKFGAAGLKNGTWASTADLT